MICFLSLPSLWKERLQLRGAEINWLDEPESQACSRLMHLIRVNINLNRDRRAHEQLPISAVRS